MKDVTQDKGNAPPDSIVPLWNVELRMGQRTRAAVGRRRRSGTAGAALRPRNSSGQGRQWIACNRIVGWDRAGGRSIGNP